MFVFYFFVAFGIANNGAMRCVQMTFNHLEARFNLLPVARTSLGLKSFH